MIRYFKASKLLSKPDRFRLYMKKRRLKYRLSCTRFNTSSFSFIPSSLRFRSFPFSYYHQRFEIKTFNKLNFYLSSQRLRAPDVAAVDNIFVWGGK
jgi:hypothetical protein